MIEGAVRRVREAIGGSPIAGAVVLGSGLGGLLDAWVPTCVWSAEDLPGYPRSGVVGHAGRMAIVRWGEAHGLVFQGRVHFYEGYRRKEVTFGVRLAAALGARWVILTNAAGSADPLLAPGSVMVVQDQIRLFVGRGAGQGAVAGPARSGSPYCEWRAAQAFRALAQEGLRTLRGVLYGCTGPSYETAAEVEMIRRLGGSAACMSTVIEAEEAWRLGMDVVAFSLITNWATGLSGRALEHAEVVAAASRIAGPMARALDALARTWAAEPSPPG